MTEQQSSAPEPDRYSVESVRIKAETTESFEAALQKELNDGSKHSWKLISVVHSPVDDGVLLVWDLQGFISG
ncbi:hypothetical protein BH23ACT11_BH23ACT11_05250 [soil metagenome]